LAAAATGSGAAKGADAAFGVTSGPVPLSGDAFATVLGAAFLALVFLGVAFFGAAAFAFLGAVVLDAVFVLTGFWVVSVILLHLYI
jgi:hypothetical protein